MKGCCVCWKIEQKFQLMCKNHLEELVDELKKT